MELPFYFILSFIKNPTFIIVAFEGNWSLPSLGNSTAAQHSFLSCHHLFFRNEAIYFLIWCLWWPSTKEDDHVEA
jgi:hypothetical protein